MMTDSIADMLSQIRNAIAVGKREVSLPYSKVKEAVAKALVENNYLETTSIDGEGSKKQLVITIFPEGGTASISNLKRLSTPGRRLYCRADEIPAVKSGRGMIIISTSKGVMSGQKAKEQRLGGELICEVV